MQYFGQTDIGKMRKINQDGYYINENLLYFIVADGMGGHRAGDVASKTAISAICEYANNHLNDDPLEIVKRAVDEANKKVFELAKSNEEYSGMGTTIEFCFYAKNECYICHVGDSRVYKIKDKIERITVDHSIVEMLVQEGSISSEEAKTHPQKNIITRALGIDKNVDSEVYTIKANLGDKFLICTDGLTNMLSDKEILEIVKDGEEPKSVVENLISSANENGGTDNITAILIWEVQS